VSLLAPTGGFEVVLLARFISAPKIGRQYGTGTRVRFVANGLRSGKKRPSPCAKPHQDRGGFRAQGGGGRYLVTMENTMWMSEV